jgi:hypothetical protein
MKKNREDSMHFNLELNAKFVIEKDYMVFIHTYRTIFT